MFLEHSTLLSDPGLTVGIRCFDLVVEEPEIDAFAVHSDHGPPLLLGLVPRNTAVLRGLVQEGTAVLLHGPLVEVAAVFGSLGFPRTLR